MATAPVIDPQALRRLGEQLGDATVLCGFLRRYIALLDERISRLECALRAGDQADWMDAVLSLKTSSSLAGAQALAEQAAALQEETLPCRASAAPDRMALPPRAQRVACLRSLAAETAHQLRIFLQLAGTGSRSS